MNTPDAAFQALLARLRAGEESAAKECFEMFSRRLIAVAQKHLRSTIRQTTDPEDITQSVFRSFFLRTVKSDYEFADSNALWNMLVVITIRKCKSRIKFFNADRRDVAREQLSKNAEREGPGEWDFVAKEPSPVEAVMLAETVEQLLKPLNPRDREIVTLHLQGFKIPEISAQIGRSERTVFRVLEQARNQLQSIHQAG